jgi:hypothetical protein
MVVQQVTAKEEPDDSLRVYHGIRLSARPLADTPRTRLAAAVWALLPNLLLGAARWPAKSAMKSVDRFWGNPRLDVTVAQADLMHTLLADVTEVLLMRGATDPHDGVHQILTLNVHTHGQAVPLAWRTVCQARLTGQMRTMEMALC